MFQTVISDSFILTEIHLQFKIFVQKLEPLLLQNVTPTIIRLQKFLNRCQIILRQVRKAMFSWNLSQFKIIPNLIDWVNQFELVELGHFKGW